MKRTKIENDFQLGLTRERLAGLKRAREGYREDLTPEQFVLTEPGLGDWIDKLQGEIDEYLAVYGDPATRAPRQVESEAMATSLCG